MSDQNMDENSVDLCGKMCPYPVVELIEEVDNMNPGEQKVFFVDDPLAIKSVPEELEDYDDLDISIVKERNMWKITVKKDK